MDISIINIMTFINSGTMLNTETYEMCMEWFEKNPHYEHLKVKINNLKPNIEESIEEDVFGDKMLVSINEIDTTRKFVVQPHIEGVEVIKDGLNVTIYADKYTDFNNEDETLKLFVTGCLDCDLEKRLRVMTDGLTDDNVDNIEFHKIDFIYSNGTSPEKDIHEAIDKLFNVLTIDRPYNPSGLLVLEYIETKEIVYVYQYNNSEEDSVHDVISFKQNFYSKDNFDVTLTLDNGNTVDISAEEAIKQKLISNVSKYSNTKGLLLLDDPTLNPNDIKYYTLKCEHCDHGTLNNYTVDGVTKSSCSNTSCNTHVSSFLINFVKLCHQDTSANYDDALKLLNLYKSRNTLWIFNRDTSDILRDCEDLKPITDSFDYIKSMGKDEFANKVEEFTNVKYDDLMSGNIGMDNIDAYYNKHIYMSLLRLNN